LKKRQNWSANRGLGCGHHTTLALTNVAAAAKATPPTAQETPLSPQNHRHKTTRPPPTKTMTTIATSHFSGTLRPVLGFCLGHQVLAHALGGLVQPRTGPDRHYALQESDLLLSFAGIPEAADTTVVWDAVSMVRRQKESGIGGGSLEGAPPLRLLYHHNDEVVKLPPNATNISTSPRCEIHGMIMVPKTTKTTTTATTATTTEGDGSSLGLVEHFTPNLLTFQAHPELSYEYGREVMNGMLDGDVARGRITHEEASRLKEQV
ncbi:unnamed protein product, partial [Ectocarpus sp. 13 AM-2016]